MAWQHFEELAAFIFSENDFLVEVRKAKTLKKKRRQYDVMAKRDNKTILIECKKWAGNRYRLSALKAAVQKHIERLEFCRVLTNETVTPIIVTFIEDSYEDSYLLPLSAHLLEKCPIGRLLMSISLSIAPYF